MEPKEALQFLDSCAANAHANRDTHVKIQQATQILDLAIATKPDKKNNKKAKK